MTEHLNQSGQNVPGLLAMTYLSSTAEARPQLLAALEAVVLTLPTRSQLSEAYSEGNPGREGLAKRYKDAALQCVRINHPDFDPDGEDRTFVASLEYRTFLEVMYGVSQEEMLTGLEVIQEQLPRPRILSFGILALSVRDPKTGEWKRRI